MKKFIYSILAILSLIAVTSCEKGDETTEEPKDARGQWLISMNEGTLAMIDVRYTYENSFAMVFRTPKEGYDPSGEETPSNDPYDPNYEWICPANFIVDSSDRTTEGLWTIVKTPEEYGGVTIRYSITSRDIMICETVMGGEETTYICTRLDPPVEFKIDEDK